MERKFKINGEVRQSGAVESEYFVPYSNSQKILVWAGHYNQYLNFKQEMNAKGIDPRHFRYIDGPKTVMGVASGTKYICYGTYHERKDAQQINCYLQGYSAEEITQEEIWETLLWMEQ